MATRDPPFMDDHVVTEDMNQAYLVDTIEKAGN
jgi:hypothetical protein